MEALGGNVSTIGIVRSSCSIQETLWSLCVSHNRARDKQVTVSQSSRPRPAGPPVLSSVYDEPPFTPLEGGPEAQKELQPAAQGCSSNSV